MMYLPTDRWLSSNKIMTSIFAQKRGWREGREATKDDFSESVGGGKEGGRGDDRLYLIHSCFSCSLLCYFRDKFKTTESHRH